MRILSLQLTTLLLLVANGIAQSLASPNGQYIVESGTAIRIVEDGTPVFTVVEDLQGVRHLDVRWSPDSSRVLIATDFVRGTYIYAAYRQDGNWQRALEVDPPALYDDLAKQAGASGRGVKGLRGLGHCLNNRQRAVDGHLTFSSQQEVAFNYILTFSEAPTRVSRGGFSEGAVKGQDFHTR